MEQKGLSIKRLIYSVLAFLAFWYFYFASTYSLRPFPQLFWIVMAVISFLLGLLHRYKISRMDICFFLAVFVLFIISLFSIDAFESIETVGYFVIYYIVAKMVVVNCDRDTIHNIVFLFSVVHLVCLFVQVLSPSIYTSVLLPLLPSAYHNTITEQMNWNAAYYGFSIQSSMSAMYLSIGAILSAIKLKNSDLRIKKGFYLGLIALFLIATFYTQRRGSSAAALVVLALIYMRTKGSRGSKILLALSIIALVTVVGVQNIPGLSGVMNKLTTFIATGSFMNGRDSNFARAFTAFLERPILGYGGGQVSAAMGYAWLENSFLAVLLQWGLIGFMFFFYPFIKMYKDTITKMKIEKGRYNPYIEFSFYLQILFFVMSFIEDYYGTALNCFLFFVIAGAGVWNNRYDISLNEDGLLPRDGN